MSEPVIKFRNYVPKTEDLKKLAVEKPVLPSVELSQTLKTATPSDSATDGEFVTAGGLEPDANAFKGILQSTETIDPVSIAPKKANWDLKRDVEKRLTKLERQTQNAIRELIRRKLEEQGAEGDKDVAEAVAAHAGADAGEESD